MNGLSKGLLFKEQFVCITEASDKADGIGRLKRQVAQSFAGKVENIDFGFEFADVRNKDLLVGNRPVLDARFALRHDISELWFLVLPWTDFYDSKVRCVPVGNRQDPSVPKQQRSELVLRTPDNRLWVA